jgi:hypothetical protein
MSKEEMDIKFSEWEEAGRPDIYWDGYIRPAMNKYQEEITDKLIEKLGKDKYDKFLGYWTGAGPGNISPDRTYNMSFLMWHLAQQFDLKLKDE